MRSHSIPGEGGFTHCYNSWWEDKPIPGKVDEEGNHAVCLKRHRRLMKFLFPKLLKSVWERGGLMGSALSESSTASKLEKCTKPWVSAGYRLIIDWVGKKNIAHYAVCASHHLIKELAVDNTVGPFPPRLPAEESGMRWVIIYHFMALWRNCRNSAWKPALILIYKNKAYPCLQAHGFPIACHSCLCLLLDDPQRAASEPLPACQPPDYLITVF